MNNKKLKRKTKKKSSSVISKSKLVKIFLLIFLFALIASALSYFIMKNESPNKSINNDILKSEIKENVKVQKSTKSGEFKIDNLDKYFDELTINKNLFEEETEELKKDFINEEEHHIKHPVEIKEKVKKKLEEKQIKKPVEQKKKKETYTYNKNNKAKLIIVIDDVSTKRQKKAISTIGYKVTMAFLPPQKGHPNSAKIAQDLPFYIIHLPMQASSKFKSTEIVTLNVNDSYERIEGIVKNLRKIYPKAKYTNNHTGSVFTSNEKAMDRLFRALKKHNFIFVDSRTSAKSVAQKYAKKYNMPYIVRNTFLDNKKDYAYIQNQLKKAINIAKKRGYAIAIGHPHSMTIKVLRESKHLYKDVELVYLNKLPYL